MPQRALPVVLVDDEEDLLFATSYLLGSNGIAPVVTQQDGRDLLPYLASNRVGMVLLDLFMPKVGGLELLPKLVEHHPDVPVVIMTAAQDVDTAVACMRVGAFDYLVKPVEESRLVSSVRRALEVHSLRDQLGTLRASLLSRRLHNPDAFAGIITGNRSMLSVFQYIEAIADSREPVLITGETGTGKELLAEAVHRLSGGDGELVCINVAGLDDNLFADTLFGHVRGAFTGADRDRRGAVAQATGGTLFLDEIGDLGKASQVKLLRLLQEHSYYPLGSDLQQRSDARVVAATNQALHKRMARGKFRQDLYFRLSSHPIDIPPLRDRQDDIPLLVQHFIDEAMRRAKDNQGVAATLLGITRQSLNRRLLNRQRS